MGHDISGYNKAGEQIAYARFSMANYNATILYSLLDANKYDAGVSGSGDSSTFSTQQIEKALNAFNQLYDNSDSLSESALGSRTNPEFYTKLFSNSTKRRECKSVFC